MEASGRLRKAKAYRYTAHVFLSPGSTTTPFVPNMQPLITPMSISLAIQQTDSNHETLGCLVLVLGIPPKRDMTMNGRSGMC